MKHSIIAALLLLSVSPIAAIADTPSEAQCDAAFHVDDYTGAIVYCRAEAEEHLVNAASLEGQPKGVQIMMAGECMAQVGMAYKFQGDPDSARLAFSEAYESLEQAAPYITTSRMLSVLGRERALILRFYTP